MHIKARVENGRIKADEPIDLPEGTEVTLYVADVDDGLDDAEREELHKALAESQEDIKAGRLVDAADVLKGLRSR
jgi:predicted DNA-binding antitoxin AbrB/MazE fold protein